jgi:hypothetical protein
MKLQVNACLSHFPQILILMTVMIC